MAGEALPVGVAGEHERRAVVLGGDDPRAQRRTGCRRRQPKLPPHHRLQHAAARAAHRQPRRAEVQRFLVGNARPLAPHAEHWYDGCGLLTAAAGETPPALWDGAFRELRAGIPGGAPRRPRRQRDAALTKAGRAGGVLNDWGVSVLHDGRVAFGVGHRAYELRARECDGAAAPAAACAAEWAPSAHTRFVGVGDHTALVANA